MNALPGIRRFDPADSGTASKLVDLDLAALAVDDPGGPEWSRHVNRARLTLGPPIGSPSEVWWVPGGVPGGIAAWCQLWLPDRENLRSSRLQLIVHPAARRQGLGTALLRDAAERARASGRVRLDGLVIQGSAGDAFARRTGASIGLTGARRVLDLSQVPAGHIASCREKAAAAAGGYSLVSWLGLIPEEYLTGVAAMTTAMNDAPSMPNAQPDIWDAQRVRDQMDGWLTAVGSRGYHLAAICDATGEMAALTTLRVDPDVPRWAIQGDTVVARSHRGRRLGMLLKSSMLEWLGEAEPQLQRIRTFNAASNSRMIAINEELGFAPYGEPRYEVELAIAG